uniref:Putative piggybac n=1 Tax=Ixodes ricinus TaxID=34613 RepID=A0A0K8R5C4_IXORI
MSYRTSFGSSGITLVLLFAVGSSSIYAFSRDPLEVEDSACISTLAITALKCSRSSLSFLRTMALSQSLWYSIQLLQHAMSRKCVKTRTVHFLLRTVIR